MPILTGSFLALGLAITPAATGGHWMVATGTGACSVSMVDFADGPNGFAAGSFNCGLVSSDGGYSWSAVEVIPAQSQSLAWAHATTADELYAARNGLYRSMDRGASWTQVGPWDVNSSGTLFDIAFLGSGRMVAIKGGQTWTSSDAGDNWTLRYAGEMDRNFHELHFPTASLGFATGGVVRGSSGNGIGTVLRSDDGGDSWSLIEFAHGAITAADFVDSDHAMAAVQNHWTTTMYVTTDGAQTWQALPVAPAGYITNLKHRDADHWYATNADGCIFSSSDGGQSWRQGYCDENFRALASISLRGGAAAVAAGNDGLVLYEDGIFDDGFDSP